MGLKSDIKKAYVRHMTEDKKNKITLELTKEQDEKFEKLAQDLTNAFIDFLTHDDLHFTISKLKASVELEEFKLSGDIDADVKSEKIVKDKVSELEAAKTGADYIMDIVDQIANFTVIVPSNPAVPFKPFAILLKPILLDYKTYWLRIKNTVVSRIRKTEGVGDINIPAFDFRKDGGKHGGELDGRGHAYVGVDDPVKNSDTINPESDDNSVELYRNKIPDELLT